MAGGGSRVSKGRMGSQVVEDIDPKELDKLESQLEKVTTVRPELGPSVEYPDLVHAVESQGKLVTDEVGS